MVTGTLCKTYLQVAIELPYILVQSLIYGVLVYAMIGFEWTVAKFFWYMFFMYFTLLYFTFYGMMAVGLTPNYNISSIVSSAFYAIWNVFSGFIIPRPVSSTHLGLLISFKFCPWCNMVIELKRFIFLLFFFLLHRKFLFGGDGTIGYAPFHGLCTDWLLHSLVILMIINSVTLERLCQNFLGATLDSNTVFLE